MRFRHLLDRSDFTRRCRQAARRRRRVLVELLEDRRLLATFTVVTGGDAGSGTCTAGQCTLRDAVIAANGSAGADEIRFHPSVTGTISLTAAGGELQVTDPVSIIGPGAGQLTVQADAAATEFRVMDVLPGGGDVAIEGLTLTGGRVLSEAGGAIRFQSTDTLTIRSSTITGNQAANGGGIYSLYEGNVVITDSSVSGNTAVYGAGGGVQAVDGDITVTSSVIDSNEALNSGGGLFAQHGGNVTLTDSDLTNNRVTYAGYNGAGLNGGDGNVTITGSTITGNTSAGDGGGIYNYGGTVTIADTDISNNDAAYSGGGILNETAAVSISNTTITNNRALYGDGGGVATGNGNVTLTRSTISGNRSVDSGGGVSTNTGSVIGLASTISGNSAGDGGGGISSLSGLVALTNVTLSGNNGNTDGGGIQSVSAPIRLVNSTVTANHAGDDGGGIGMADNNDGESLSIENSIVAQNTSAMNNPDFTAPGGGGANLQVFNSLIGDNEGTTLAPSALLGGVPQPDAQGNLVGGGPNPNINPMLGTLAFNGGTTQTHALLGGSLAIDAGDDALAIDPGADGLPGGGDDTPLTSDQREFPFLRFVDSGSGAATVDMGAVEFQPAPVFLVDTDTDIVDGDLSAGNRSLREVIQLTNASVGLDLVRIDPSVAGTITLLPALGSLTITDPVSIAGPGADQLTVAPQAGSSFRVFDIAASAGDVSISGLTLTRGNPNDVGGAIWFRSTGTLLISHSTLRANQATQGAAIFNDGGTVNIVASTLSGNDANSHGGGVAALAGSIHVTSSTISGNSSNGFGGGIYSVDATVSLINSTVTLNQAGLQGGGVGLIDDDGGETLTIENSIVAANTALNDADFIAPGAPGTNLNVDFSLIGDNSGTTLAESVIIGGTPQPDARGNLIGGGANPVISPLVDPLGDNGGPTPTHALRDGSLAIDRGGSHLLPSDAFDIDGDGDLAETLPTDQRGAGRLVGAGLDIGAFEIPPVASVTWEMPEDITFGTLLGATQLDATANTPGTFVYTPDVGTQLNVGNGQVLSVVFTPDDLLAFQAATATTQINVLKGDPVITWDDPADIDFGTQLSATQLNATADVNGTFVYSPGIGTTLDGGASQPLMVTFTPDDTANYNVVSATVNINVNPVDPVITWNDPADIVFGTPLSATQLNATADVAGTFVYNPAIDTILNAGTGQQLSVTFTPDQTANHNVVQATVMISVSKADPVITWNDPADISVGTQLSATQLNATADVAGTFVYDPAAGTTLPAGNGQTLGVTFTPDDTANYNVVQATAQVNVTASLDYGDAPASYPVTLADDGARHVVGSLRLGADIDIDADGNPTAAADGDGADEDGVSVIANPVADPTTDTVASFLVTASATSLLDAWVDFNGDGDWDDAGEQIATSAALSAGPNVISYLVPAGATAGDTAARFRVSSAGNLAPTGEAADGEVEDYIVAILDGSAAPDATVMSPATTTIVRFDQGDSNVGDGQVTLMDAPTDAIGRLDVQSGDTDDTVTVDLSGDGIPAAGLKLDAMSGDNTLAVIGQSPFDLTDTGNVDATNFINVDLTDASANTITIDAASVSQLSPANNTIAVIGSEGDAIDFADAADWGMTEPAIAGGRFIRVATNAETGQVVEIDLPDPWQNPIEASDVNNDRRVSASDALRVINELSRRNFSDENSETLNDAISTTPWPGVYFDQNGDGRASALDALRVINRMAQIANGGSGEAESIVGQFSEPASRRDFGEIADRVVFAASSQSIEVPLGDFAEIDSATQPAKRSTEIAGQTRSGVSQSAVDQLLSDESFAAADYWGM